MRKIVLGKVHGRILGVNFPICRRQTGVEPSHWSVIPRKRSNILTIVVDSKEKFPILIMFAFPLTSSDLVYFNSREEALTIAVTSR